MDPGVLLGVKAGLSIIIFFVLVKFIFSSSREEEERRRTKAEIREEIKDFRRQVRSSHSVPHKEAGELMDSLMEEYYSYEKKT